MAQNRQNLDKNKNPLLTSAGFDDISHNPILVPAPVATIAPLNRQDAPKEAIGGGKPSVNSQEFTDIPLAGGDSSQPPHVGPPPMTLYRPQNLSRYPTNMPTSNTNSFFQPIPTEQANPSIFVPSSNPVDLVPNIHQNNPINTAIFQPIQSSSTGTSLSSRNQSPIPNPSPQPNILTNALSQLFPSMGPSSSVSEQTSQNQVSSSIQNVPLYPSNPPVQSQVSSSPSVLPPPPSSTTPYSKASSAYPSALQKRPPSQPTMQPQMISEGAFMFSSQPIMSGPFTGITPNSQTEPRPNSQASSGTQSSEHEPLSYPNMPTFPGRMPVPNASKPVSSVAQYPGFTPKSENMAVPEPVVSSVNIFAPPSAPTIDSIPKSLSSNDFQTPPWTSANLPISRSKLPENSSANPSPITFFSSPSSNFPAAPDSKSVNAFLPTSSSFPPFSSPHPGNIQNPPSSSLMAPTPPFFTPSSDMPPQPTDTTDSKNMAQPSIPFFQPTQSIAAAFPSGPLVSSPSAPQTSNPPINFFTPSISQPSSAPQISTIPLTSAPVAPQTTIPTYSTPASFSPSPSVSAESQINTFPVSTSTTAPPIPMFSSSAFSSAQSISSPFTPQSSHASTSNEPSPITFFSSSSFPPINEPKVPASIPPTNIPSSSPFPLAPSIPSAGSDDMKKPATVQNEGNGVSNPTFSAASSLPDFSSSPVPTDPSCPLQTPPQLQTIPPPPRKSVSHTPPPPYNTLGFEENKETESTVFDSNIHTGIIDDNGLEQIPLEDTVPFFNPVALNAQKPLQKKSEPGNTFRLKSGLKRPTYAPDPNLEVSHQLKNQTYNLEPNLAVGTNVKSEALPAILEVSQHPTAEKKPETEVINTIEPENHPTAEKKQETEVINTIESENMAASQLIARPSSLSPQSSTSSPPGETVAFSTATTGQIYRPAYHHWFFKSGAEPKSSWQPFSMADSMNLEQAFTSSDISQETKVSTDGGRYDVEVLRRRKMAVYWEEDDGEVRRCSWFVKTIDGRYIPYDENIAEILEDAYRDGCMKNEWNKRVELADGEVIILHSPNAMAHHQRSSSPDTWGNAPPMQQKPRIVKRGVDDFEIAEGEPNQVDHLLLVVHGIGKACDLRFRTLVQVVDDFRTISHQLVQSHFKTGTENGNVGRVEVLPVEWHRALHTEVIDQRLADITLPSIPRAREFTNETLLDILFYTSPVFCEKIVQAVGAELNRVYQLYTQRNPGFRGGVSIGGHSLGSLILFDMLSHQKTIHSPISPQSSIPEDEDMPEMGFLKSKAKLNRRMSYLTIGSSGTGQPYINYPQLNFQPQAFFAFGSPIGMFITVRGLDALGEDFKFPTCPRFFNIFHPNDPVAYRIEALISPEMSSVPPVMIPHHKGRKRMHLELKETMAHVTAALKQKLVDSVRSTWNTVYQLAMFQRPDPSLQHEVDKVLQDEVMRGAEATSPTSSFQLTEEQGLELRVGSLNQGNRIDYVLQEAPLETFNQYISAVRSHLVYWESEDTMLLVLKEIYKSMGISSDSQVPQQILPFDIENFTEYTDSIGAPPTQFVRK